MLLLLLGSIIVSMWSAFKAFSPPEREHYFHTLETVPRLASEDEVALVWPGVWKPPSVWWKSLREVQVVQTLYRYIYPIKDSTDVAVLHATPLFKSSREEGILHVRRPYGDGKWGWEMRFVTKVYFKVGNRRALVLEREDIYRSPFFSPSAVEGVVPGEAFE